MAHLADMEELLQNITNSNIANYMEEALKCYNSGAYRGCIVLSCIALFDDLVRKLSEIRHVNKKAKEIHDEVVKRINNQDVYESYLLDQLASSKIISELDSSTVDVIKTRRNKSAHASGHSSSAEEARFVYSEVISKFLAKEAFSSKVLADEIMSRIENGNFFPSIMIDDIKNVVAHEINLLHTDAYPYLLTKLLDAIKNSTGSISNNANYFIDGLVANNKPEFNKVVVNKLLEKYLDDTKLKDLCLSVISINPLLVDCLSSTALARLKKVITENTANIPNTTSISCPANLFDNIFNKNSALLLKLEDETIGFLNKHSYLPISPIIAQVSDDIWAKYVGILIAKAESSDFNTANNFSKQFPNIDATVSGKASDIDLLKLVIGVIKAAEWGAWHSNTVVTSKFETFVNAKAKVTSYCSSKHADAETIVAEKFGAKFTADTLRKNYFD